MIHKIKVMAVFFMLLLLILILPASGSSITKVSAGGYCDWVQFVADVTIPDGVPVDPGFVFRKIWRLKNIGTCTWTRSYKLVFVSGAPMGGVTAMNLPREVAPGQTIDLTIGLTAPTTPGTYIGYWELQNPAGGLFGIGQTAARPFFVEINVRSTAPPTYDFVTNAAAANWRTEVPGKIIFPGVYGDPLGFVIPVERPILENGLPSIGNGLLMAPPFEYNEHIYGIFPPYEVKRGDHFQAFVGCEYGSRDCGVTFVLQYQQDGAPSSTRSFWNGVKSYKNTFSRVNLSLGPLAGQKVRFILLIRPNGPTLGDHAIWANPVIVNTTESGPAVPTVTPFPVTAVPTISTLPPNTGCDRASFVSDVTVPDGTSFTPGQAFTKTWKLRNNGRCTWTTDYTLVFSTGDQMGGPSPVNLPSSVAPGQTIDLSVPLIAPSNIGSYRGYWLLRNPSGGLFGIGSLANKPFWLAINVAGAPPTSDSGYDFVAHVCDAQWTSAAGMLACPSTSPTDGTVTVVNNPRLENNTIDSRAALFIIPQNIYNGSIKGVYPPITVQNGDHFKSLINCEYAQRSCYVVFRLDYQIDNGPIRNLWAFGERYEGLYYQADVDLSSLTGQNVKFILRNDANGSPTGDHAVWVAPSIVHSSATQPAVPTTTLTAIPSATTVPGSTSTLTSTPNPSASETAIPVPTSTATVAPPANPGQLLYVNAKYGFQFSYPANSFTTTSQDNFVHMNLPFSAGTNLTEKYLEVTIFENATTCTSPLTNGHVPGSFESQVVTSLNGIQFVRESGQEGAAGQSYDWVAYSTMKGSACISLNFVLHSVNPNNYPVPPAVYNKDLESAVFLDIVSSFNLTAP